MLQNGDFTPKGVLYPAEYRTFPLAAAARNTFPRQLQTNF
jgi:hypothetical protein